MAGPRKVSQEEYDEFRSRMEEKYGYDDMSDEEKADFDAKIDQVAVVDNDKTDEGDEDDPVDGRDGREVDDGIPQYEEDDEQVR